MPSKLNEGKIVVKSLKGYSRKWTKEVYISPGQELVFDKDQRSIRVQSSDSPKPQGSGNNNPDDDPLIPRYGKRSWFMFNNRALFYQNRGYN